MDVLNLIIWKSDPPHSPGFVVVVFLRAAVICLFSDFSKRFLPRIFHLCEVSILLSQRSACDLTETKRKKKILSCFLKLALIWGIPACDTKLCPMICQWYKPTVLSRLFRAYIWPWACVLHSGFLSICESPPKFLFSHISSSSASSSLGFLVCLLLVPPNIPCPRWLRRKRGGVGDSAKQGCWWKCGKIQGEAFCQLRGSCADPPSPFLCALKWEILLCGVGAGPGKEWFCWVSMDAWTWEGCVCQLGPGPGKGREIKGWGSNKRE